MNDLLMAAKAVIDYEKDHSYNFADRVTALRAAVERAEKQEAVGFDEWYESVTIDFENCEDAARRAWTASQQAERDRIRATLCEEYAQINVNLPRIMEKIDV